jgi:hypothetical protein
MRRKGRSSNSGRQSPRLSASDHAAAAALAEQVYALAVSMLPTSADHSAPPSHTRFQVKMKYAGQPLAAVAGLSSGPMSVRANGLETMRRHLGRMLNLRWNNRCPPCRPHRPLAPTP